MVNPEGHITKISLRERQSSFEEVSCGFSEKEALKEAKRCLQCNNPLCAHGCPAGIDIKEFIRLIQEKDYQGSINKIKESNSLPGVCGRVCPQEDQCQLHCVLNKQDKPIKIGYLERFVADWELEHSQREAFKAKSKDIKAAIIGSGPAGLTCAADLAKRGYDVYLFEALHKSGGVLVYGIPEFRLPKHIVDEEVKYIESLGVNVENNFLVGRTKTIDDLRDEGFKAFFIAVGAGLPRFLNIPGESLNGVYSANEFLTRVNLMKAYLFPECSTPVRKGKRVGVFGAGNVAFDCARCALRLGAKEVTIIYRRTEGEMPARIEEIENAKEEGIKFRLLTSPVKIVDNGKGEVGGVECIKNRLGDADDSGRKRPLPIEGSEEILGLDTIIVAIGAGANPLLLSTIEGLDLNKKSYININETFQSSITDIFAAGDIVSGSATVISAIQQARVAAQAMDKFLDTLD